MRKGIVIIFFIAGLLFFGYWFKCQMGVNLVESISLGDYSPVQDLQRRINQSVFAAEKVVSIGESQRHELKGKKTLKNKIVIETKMENETVNKKVFGNNLLGFDPSINYESWKPATRIMDYGAGIWDGKGENPVEEVLCLAKESGISVLRFPGGCGTHHYNWKETIGKKRRHYWFGLDEFLHVAETLMAEPVITVSYFTGGPDDAADLVEYLNMPNDGSNPRGGVDWASMRAKNGHPKPYNVKYLEIGNEVYHGDHQYIKRVQANEYAKRYLLYYQQIKSVDGTVLVSAVLHNSKWNRCVMEKIGEKIDFGSIHIYPSLPQGEDLATWKTEEIFRYIFASPIFKWELQIKELLDLLRTKAGQDGPLAVTEYNGMFVQKDPVPYRHTLGNALLNAELLRIFIKPENHILIANHWNFVNEYWGMIANGFNGDYRALNRPYFKRPNYYVFQLYNEHFGDILIDTDVQSKSYALPAEPLFDHLKEKFHGRDGMFGKNERLSSWKITAFAGVKVEVKDGQIIINFQNPQRFNYYHTVKYTRVRPGTFYRLSGYIKTENLEDNNGVRLEVQDIRGWTNTHSAAFTREITGTTDWQYVDVIYRTLPDAQSVRIIARRVGEAGPLRGKAFFKDVKYQQWIPKRYTEIPYLSVSASKREAGDKVYLMVINKNLEESIPATIDLKDFIPASKADAWALNGPSVEATNEKDHDNVKVTHEEFEIWKQGDGIKSSFEFTFEPHSLTAIEIERN